MFSHLHRACIFDASEELIALLLKSGCKLDGVINGVTPLHIACDSGYDKLALFLLKQGATMYTTVASSSPLGYHYERYYCFKANALHLALMSNCKRASHYMIENNSDFSQVTRGGVHVFHLACRYSDRNIVKLLGEKIAYCPIDDDNLNPADYALMHQNQTEQKEILEILKRFGIFPHSNQKVQELFSNRSKKIEYPREHDASIIDFPM